VFMFNHQSKADVAIMASLVRRDVVAVGKKEIQRMPLIGQAMGIAGVVFIDRSDREKAIESMKPLVSAMQEQNKSLVIAPEGTRTPSRKLAQFKKGGFHIALQVGVPIVPVVIHNAGDIAPKGDFLFKPGKVRVDVLPPVDTSDWSLDRMDAQVNQVRNLFLNALGQPEQSLEEVVRDKRNLPDDMRPELKKRASRTKTAKSSATKKAASKKPAAKRASEKSSTVKSKAAAAKKKTGARKPAGAAAKSTRTAKSTASKKAPVKNVATQKAPTKRAATKKATNSRGKR